MGGTAEEHEQEALAQQRATRDETTSERRMQQEFSLCEQKLVALSDKINRETNDAQVYDARVETVKQEATDYINQFVRDIDTSGHSSILL